MKKKLTTTLAALLCMAGASHGLAQQVQFRKAFAPGDKINSAYTMSMQMNMSMGANGQVLQQMQQTTKQTRNGSITVEAVGPDGKFSKATFVFGPDCANEMDMGPQMGGKQVQPSSLAGKTITVTKNGEKDLHFSAEVDQMGAMELTQMFRNEQGMMPPTPVNVGEPWRIDPANLQNMIPPGSQANVNGTGKVVSLSKINGRDAALVELDINIDGDMNGMKMNMRLAGRGNIDVQTSQPLDMEMSGPMTASGTQQGPQGPMTVEMKGTLTNSVRSTVTGTPIAGPVPQPPQPPVNPPVNPPINPPVNPNPIDAAPALPQGVYTDGQLTLSLSDAGSTLKLGNQTFPVGEIMGDATNITGFFQNNGQSFQFTATVNGDTLEFQSGNRKATLKKQGAKNPLDP